MDTPTYHHTLRAALDTLRVAMTEAKALLPRAATQQHWQAGHHSPAAWRSVEAAYRNQLDADPAVRDLLCDLKGMAEALACLQSILTEPTTTGSLKLAKQKRVEI